MILKSCFRINKKRLTKRCFNIALLVFFAFGCAHKQEEMNDILKRSGKIIKELNAKIVSGKLTFEDIFYSKYGKYDEKTEDTEEELDYLVEQLEKYKQGVKDGDKEIKVDIVDIIAAEIDVERVEDVVNRDVHRFNFFAIDVEVDLRHGASERVLQRVNFRHILGGANDRFPDLLQIRQVARPAFILKLQLKAAESDPVDGRGAKDERFPFRESREFLDQQFSLFSFC